jgi:hypothetical protein
MTDKANALKTQGDHDLERAFKQKEWRPSSPARNQIGGLLTASRVPGRGTLAHVMVAAGRGPGSRYAAEKRTVSNNRDRPGTASAATTQLPTTAGFHVLGGKSNQWGAQVPVDRGGRSPSRGFPQTASLSARYVLSTRRDAEERGERTTTWGRSGSSTQLQRYQPTARYGADGFRSVGRERSPARSPERPRPATRSGGERGLFRPVSPGGERGLFSPLSPGRGAAPYRNISGAPISPIQQIAARGGGATAAAAPKVPEAQSPPQLIADRSEPQQRQTRKSSSPARQSRKLPEYQRRKERSRPNASHDLNSWMLPENPVRKYLEEHAAEARKREDMKRTGMFQEHHHNVFLFEQKWGGLRDAPGYVGLVNVMDGFHTGQ